MTSIGPAADIASARRRTDFVVHRSGDSGSPREVGSTNDNSVARTPGSVSVTGGTVNLSSPMAIFRRFASAIHQVACDV